MPIRMAAIQKSTSNKCWRWCGVKRTLLHSWEYSHYGVLCGDFSKNWKQNCHMTQQSHCWAYTLRKPELKETFTPVFIVSLFIIARTCKQPRCPSADEWLRKLWYIHTMEYYTAIKKNTFESVLMRWMKLEPIIQSEVSQREKHQYSILMYIYGIQKEGNDNSACETAKETQMYRTVFWTLWERARAGSYGRMALKHVNYHM